MRDAATTHPAIIKAQEIYDRPGDLEPHEQAFLTLVHEITKRCARIKGEANRAWGTGSRAAEATAFLANSQERHRLDRALATYEEAANPSDDADDFAQAAE